MNAWFVPASSCRCSAVVLHENFLSPKVRTPPACDLAQCNATNGASERLARNEGRID